QIRLIVRHPHVFDMHIDDRETAAQRAERAFPSIKAPDDGGSVLIVEYQIIAGAERIITEKPQSCARDVVVEVFDVAVCGADRQRGAASVRREVVARQDAVREQRLAREIWVALLEELQTPVVDLKQARGHEGAAENTIDDDAVTGDQAIG